MTRRILLLLTCVALSTTAHAAKSYTCTATVTPIASNAPAGAVPDYICEPFDICNGVDVIGFGQPKAAVHARLVLPDGTPAAFWSGMHNSHGRIDGFLFYVLPPGQYGLQLIDANKSTNGNYFVFAECGFTVL